VRDGEALRLVPRQFREVRVHALEHDVQVREGEQVAAAGKPRGTQHTEIGVDGLDERHAVGG
jgi:hypothetical protein